MAHKHGPVVVRLRTSDRAERTPVPSLTPVWRSAEFQEREIYDLYGIHFDGHPDLRRILMWDEFKDFPMRKDYRRTGRLRIRADAARRGAGKGEAALRAATGTGRRGKHRSTMNSSTDFADVCRSLEASLQSSSAQICEICGRKPFLK